MVKENQGNRKWLGILFKCCNAYNRIYKSEKGDKYQGMCPKCGRRVEVPVGKEGLDDRFFISG